MSSSVEREDEGRGVTDFFRVGFGRLHGRGRLKGAGRVFFIEIFFSP